MRGEDERNIDAVSHRTEAQRLVKPGNLRRWRKLLGMPPSVLEQIDEGRPEVAAKKTTREGGGSQNRPVDVVVAPPKDANRDEPSQERAKQTIHGPFDHIGELPSG